MQSLTTVLHLPKARCRLNVSAEGKWNMESFAIGAGLFLFVGEVMADILQVAKSYANLLDVDYQILLGKKKRNIAFFIVFDETHFFHLAGLQYLRDLGKILTGNRGKLFRKILNGKLKKQLVESSEYYSKIKEEAEKEKKAFEEKERIKEEKRIANKILAEKRQEDNEVRKRNNEELEKLINDNHISNSLSSDSLAGKQVHNKRQKGHQILALLPRGFLYALSALYARYPKAA